MSTRLRYLYRAYRYRFRVDPAEIRFVRQSLQPGQIAADIGCHKGAYTYWMRRRVGPRGIVYAFEPQPRQAAYLREAFSAMHYDNVVLVPMAVSDKCGQMPLCIPAHSTHAAYLVAKDGGGASDANFPPRINPKSASEMTPTIQVDVTTLDEFFRNADRQVPNFLKIDVEGHELSVLKGARHALQEYRPTILIECEARHRVDGDVRPVFKMLESFGYTGSFFCQGNRFPLSEFDPAVHQQLDGNSDELPRGYVNNFAFEVPMCS
jgi:FkbM family methyltransferase